MSLDPISKMLIEWQCKSLSYRVANFQDIGDFDSMSELYTVDAEINSQITTLRGREEIRSFFVEPEELVSRHVITNIVFLDVQEDRAEAIVHNTSYFTMGLDAANPFVNARLIEFRDCYQRTAVGWLIRSRTSAMVFAPEDWLGATQAMMAHAEDSAAH